MKKILQVQVFGDVNSGLEVSDPQWSDAPINTLRGGYSVVSLEVPTREWELEHCYRKVAELAAQGQTGTLAPRDLMQVGYNLGRVSEITGEGRSVWDATKGMVAEGNWGALRDWADARLSDLKGGSE